MLTKQKEWQAVQLNYCEGANNRSSRELSGFIVFFESPYTNSAMIKAMSNTLMQILNSIQMPLSRDKKRDSAADLGIHNPCLASS